jgi:hypothetical protein
VVRDWQVDVHYNIPLSRPAAPIVEKLSTNFDLCNARHDSSEIFADGQIAACQLLQCADACSAVIDRAELVHVQPVSQLAGIDPVILVPLSAILPRIAYYQFRYMRLQQIVQPGGPSSFFKGDMQLTAQPVDKIQNDVRFRLDHTFHHELPGIIPDRNRNAFLVMPRAALQGYADFLIMPTLGKSLLSTSCLARDSVF